MSAKLADQYNNIDPVAVEQFRDRLQQLLYPDGSDTLRPNAFGSAEGAIFTTRIQQETEDFLNRPVAGAEKDRLLDTMTMHACFDDRFFQEVQQTMLTHGLNVPFYSAFNTRLSQERPRVAEKEIAAHGLLLGMDGQGHDVSKLLNSTHLPRSVMSSLADVLRQRAQATGASTEAPLMGPPSMSEQDRMWGNYGELALQRNDDPAHTHAALEAIQSGNIDRFRRDTRPAAIYEAQIARAAEKRGIE